MIPPVTMPVPAPTVATDKLLLLQTPPLVGSVRVSVLPTQTFVDEADMEDGFGFTLIIFVAAHPLPRV